jgi:hypothetical protein
MRHLNVDGIMRIDQRVEQRWYKRVFNHELAVAKLAGQINDIEDYVKTYGLLDQSVIVHGFTMRPLLLCQISPQRVLNSAVDTKIIN